MFHLDPNQDQLKEELQVVESKWKGGLLYSKT